MVGSFHECEARKLERVATKKYSTLWWANIAGWKIDPWKMYFLLNMSMFQSAMLVYQRVVEMGFCNHISCMLQLFNSAVRPVFSSFHCFTNIKPEMILYWNLTALIVNDFPVLQGILPENAGQNHHAHPWQRPRSFERKRPGSQAEKAGVRVGDEVLQVRSEICRKALLDAVKKVDPGNVLNCIFRGWHTTQLL